MFAHGLTRVRGGHSLAIESVERSGYWRISALAGDAAGADAIVTE